MRRKLSMTLVAQNPCHCAAQRTLRICLNGGPSTISQLSLSWCRTQGALNVMLDKFLLHSTGDQKIVHPTKEILTLLVVPVPLHDGKREPDALLLGQMAGVADRGLAHEWIVTSCYMFAIYN